MIQEKIEKYLLYTLFAFLLCTVVSCQTSSENQEDEFALTSITDLLGYYLFTGPDTSYVLYLEQQGPHLWGKLFYQAGPMPSDKVLQRTLPRFNRTDYQLLEFDLEQRQFTSPLGKGHLHWEKDSMALVFQEFRGWNKVVSFNLLR